MNGGCGYVLKPTDVMGEVTEDGRETALSITVLSAHQLPKPQNAEAGRTVSPLVVVTVDCCNGNVQRKETQVQRNNGFNPEWHDTFEFNISNLSVAMIAFEIFDQDTTSRKFLAARAIRVCQMHMQGIRWVSLIDFRGEELKCCGLLVRITSSLHDPQSMKVDDF